ncbi:response regulator [Mucilaginibacter conchicola]|uniref:Response regulator n=1 Tax=Mucilaginibacter conchicola TaxID=2303333 RepID=A0A372NMB7_9SPHI|nr:response regulator [Mucilaginibacter conchicola]RFZ90099.1 response regulator [Mucilaginibacter conchicola]
MVFLIVDDQDIKIQRISLVIQEAMSPDKPIILSVNNVSQAVFLLQEQSHIDLMILDLNLPVRHGEDVKPLAGLNVIKEITRRPAITRPKYIIGNTAENPIRPEAIRFFEREGWVLISLHLNQSDWEETIANRIQYSKPQTGISILRKIVLLASSPKNLRGLNVGTELRKIEDTIRMATHRDKFTIVSKSGGMYTNLVREIISHKPEILHLSGHGDGEGIAMEDENGNCDYVPLETLESLLKVDGLKTSCIILNTCYSAQQAKSLSLNNLYVIGMTNSTVDNYAESFSQGFYQGIGELTSIPVAFQLGIASLQKSHPHQVTNPQLWFKGNLVN